MNQILNYVSSNVVEKKSNGLFLKIIFLASLIILSFSLIFLFLYVYTLNFKDKATTGIAETFSLSRMYENNSNYAVSSVSTESKVEDNSSPFIIGIIKINKLKLDYPIISDVSDDLLKVAPCRFAGPMPNEVGNLCIAGHNYIDNTFFARISSLQIDDVISIYGFYGDCVDYSVFDKYEVDSSDFSCTSQDTNSMRIITLMTCNSLKGTRIIIQAREKI